MTSHLWPSTRASALSAPVFAAVVTMALLLCLPASSFAGADRRAGTSQTERGESSETALASADLLARGSGYGTQAGSKEVRELQLRLRRLGHRPGPIDGLFGALTQASVERFQRRRGLLVDGVVGPQTRARLLALPLRRPATPQGSATPEPGAPDRLTPHHPAPANVAPLRDPAPDAGAARRAARKPESSDGLNPWIAALLGAIAMGVLLAGVSRLGRPRADSTSAWRAPYCSRCSPLAPRSARYSRLTPLPASAVARRSPAARCSPPRGRRASRTRALRNRRASPGRRWQRGGIRAGPVPAVPPPRRCRTPPQPSSRDQGAFLAPAQLLAPAPLAQDTRLPRPRPRAPWPRSANPAPSIGCEPATRCGR